MISKRKARRLRREGVLNAPSTKIGKGHIVYSGAGKHVNKKHRHDKKYFASKLAEI